jgi:hypothetical protein
MCSHSRRITKINYLVAGIWEEPTFLSANPSVFLAAFVTAITRARLRSVKNFLVVLSAFLLEITAMLSFGTAIIAKIPIKDNHNDKFYNCESPLIPAYLLHLSVITSGMATAKAIAIPYSNL